MKCRKLLSAVLALCMVLGSMAAFAAEIPEVTYDYSAITFSYGTDAASALQGGKTLTAKVSVSKTGGEQNLTFAMMLYKNNKPVDVDISTKAVDSEKVDFDVSINTPSDVSGCSVVVFMWDSLKSMKAICNSAIFPLGSTKVSAITIDGASLVGFNPDVHNYTYEVDADRTDAPVITAKAFDGSAKINIVDPVDFPGKSVVEALLPDGTKGVYTISYTAKGNTEFLKDLTTCYDNKLPEEVGGNITHLAEYAPKSFEVGQLGYLNRNYTITTINDSRLLGKDRVMQSYSLTSTTNGGAEKDVSVFQSKETHPWINFTLLRGATVRVLLCKNDQKAKLTELGYKEEVSDNANGFFNVMVGTANKAHKYMYSKHYDAGTRVSIPNVGEGNNSVYTVVVDYDPFGYVPGEDEEPEDPTPDTPVVPDEPDEPKDESLDIKTVSVGGVAVDGFSSDTLEYTVNLSADMAIAKDAPVVSYELADSTSTAVVTNPTEFPGKATITVTNAENDTRTYVLNYSVENVLDITTNVADKNLMYIPQGLDIGGRVAADRDPKATWYISEINYEAFKKNDLIVGGVNSTEGVNEFTFNLPRKATVTVVYNTAGLASIVNANGAILKEKGFTYENDTSYYKIVVSNKLNTTQRWYRMMYYKNMEVGEYTLPYCVPEMPALVTVNYIPWGADDFDTEEPDTPDVPDVPDVPEVNDLALKYISVDGVKVANFDADTKEYTVNLTNAQAGALDAPVVTYELEDTKSSAVVVNPTEFPGKATVTVTNTKNETNTYTLNYALAEELLAITTNAAGQNMMYKPGGFKLGGWLASDRNADEGSWSISTINVPELIGNDSIFGGVNATANVTRVTLNLPRAATVRALVNTIGNADIHARINNELTADGFAVDGAANTDKVVASLNNVTRIYQKMFAKNIEAGDITIPYGVPDMPMMIALDYLPWGDNTFVEPVDPEAGIKLKSLKIDGVEVDGFDADTTEYTVALTDSQLASAAVPRVTYKLMADSSEATVTNPETFPGKATVTVTDGEGGERTYTVTYTAEEMIKDMYVLNKNNTISKEYTGGANDVVLSGNNLPKYVRSGLVEYTDKQPIYTDRNGLRGIHDTTLIGNDVILTPVNWSQDPEIKVAFGGNKALDWLNFTVKRDAVVKVFTDSRNPNNSNITDYGFVKNTNGIMNVDCCNTARAYFCNKINGTLDRCQTIMYTKSFTAGEKVVIPNFTFNDYSYSVAIEYPGWGEEVYIPVVPKATLSDIKVDGVSIAGFDADTFDYEVEFDVAALTMPTVTYTVNGEGTAVVAESTSFPGEAKITVTEDGEENVYTLKYVPSMEYITDLKLCDEAEVASTYAVFPKVVSGIKVGDKHFTDRPYAIETINELGIENSDRIMTSTGWKWDETNNYSKVFNGNAKSDWMSFTLNRGAYVTVYDDSTSDNNMFIGFETETSSTPYIYVKYNETRGASYTVKHTRYFTAGSQVNIPNASTAETYAVVINYAPWNFIEPEVEEIPEFKISYSDLVPKVTSGENANVTVGNWYNYISESVMNKKFSKEFAMPEGSDTQTITLTLDKFTNQNVAIIVNPTEEGASKDVIVNSDGSAIEWNTHDQASVDYDYEGAGEDGYNADYVTYAQYAKNVTTLSSGDSYVYRTMVSSDDKYITGSMVVYSRNLLCGGVSWIDIPEEYLGCNYIVPQDGKINGGKYTLTFTVNAPVEVAIYTNGTAATVSDDISEDAWTIETASFKKRHMNVVDNLTIAYMIKKGYLPVADLGAYATANNTNGYRIRRFDLFSQLQEDCGVANGWAIDPAKKEATGFTGTINDYTYDQYLAAWVDEE